LLCIFILYDGTLARQTNPDKVTIKTRPFMVQFGVFAKHSFPLATPDNQIGLPKYITTTSRSNIIDNGFEIYIGYEINEKFDLFTGTRLSFNLLEDYKSPDRRDYDLHYKRIYIPIKARYHLVESYLLFDCVELELAWSRILSPVFGWDSNSQVDAGWHKTKLDYLNNKNPFSISAGVSKSFIFNKVTLFLSPYFQYDLNRNQILEGFYNPSTFGLKIIGECKL